MKFVQMGIGDAEFTGHVVYTLDEHGQIWVYTPPHVSSMGNTYPARWAKVEGPNA